MRFKVEVSELNEVEWKAAQRILKTEYEFAPGSSRACVVVVHGEEERHVEMPGGPLSSLILSLSIAQTLAAMRMALAALAPDSPDLPAEPTVDQAVAGADNTL